MFSMLQTMKKFNELCNPQKNIKSSPCPKPRSVVQYLCLSSFAHYFIFSPMLVILVEAHSVFKGKDIL